MSEKQCQAYVYRADEGGRYCRRPARYYKISVKSGSVILCKLHAFRAYKTGVRYTYNFEQINWLRLQLDELMRSVPL